MKAVRKHTTAEERKKAWAWTSGRDNDDLVEFHGPNDFYWVGCGHCLWDAKAGGWSAWLQANGFTDD